MAVNVLIPTPLRQYTDGRDVVQASGGTVAEVLADLGRQYAGMTERLMDGDKVRRFVNLYVNDEDVRYLQKLDTPVAEGDELSIIPAVAGGCTRQGAKRLPETRCYRRNRVSWVGQGIKESL